jgi:DNA repair exonuclease SbcCD ATPase subunit
MRLRSIQLRNFKRLSDYRAEFSRGINVVKGSRNEMGKSTLLEGIIAALFYNPKTTSKEIRDCVSWGATRQYATTLEFEDEARRYLLQKDFEKKTIRLADDEGRAELDTFNEVAERLTVLLGTRSEKLFLSSACIRQSQVSEISAGKREIGESLEEIVTGGEENTLASQVIQKLDARVAEMKRGVDMPAKNPGVLASLTGQLREATQRHSSIREEVSRVEAQKVKLMEASKLLAQVRAEYEGALALLDKNRRRQDIEAAVDRLTKDFNATEELLRRIRAEQEACNKAEEGLGGMEGFPDQQLVSALRTGLDDIHRKREDVRRDLAEREEELAQTRRKLEARRAVTLLGSTPALVLALAALAGG